VATPTLERMVSALFSAPANAVTEAEQAYRSIWMKWLKDVQGLITKATLDTAKVKDALAEHLKLAPIMKLNGRIEMALTMRIASVSEVSGSIGINLGIGPIGVTGSFGMMSRTSEESVLQVRAEYTLTNEEVSLEKYLANWNIGLASPADVEKAIAFLT
jgi:hypothetical protein